MIATMFNELKVGDRFYYENYFNPMTHFNLTQINEIRKIKIAKIICDNLDINTIQVNPFSMPDPITNPIVSCDEFPDINYSLFIR